MRRAKLSTAIVLSLLALTCKKEPPPAFEGNGAVAVRALFLARGQIPNGASLAIVVRDAQTRDVLQELHRFTAGRDTVVRVGAVLNYGTRRVVLSVASSNCGRPRGFELERWYEPGEFSSAPTSSLARFAATDASGGVKLAQVMKLVVTK